MESRGVVLMRLRATLVLFLGLMFEIGAYGFTDSGDYTPRSAGFAYLFAAPAAPRSSQERGSGSFSLPNSVVR
jgi:hypothetical protein